MFATCITELIYLNVVLASIGAHILKMDEPEVPSGGSIIYYFMLPLNYAPTFFSPHHSTVAVFSVRQKMSLSLLLLQACLG